MQILLVDPEMSVEDVRRVETCVAGRGIVTTAGSFELARAMLRSAPPSFLITNIRLAAFNGIHLILLAGDACTRHLAYLRTHDRALASEAQRAGAFYERFDHLFASLPAYLGSALPAGDRRNPDIVDRRRFARLGRRAGDVMTMRRIASPAIISRPAG